MNILYTITRCWPAIGGAEVLVQQLASGLSGQHRTAVVAHTDQQQTQVLRDSTVFARASGQQEVDGVRTHFLAPTLAGRIAMLPVLRLYHYPRTKGLGLALYAAAYEAQLLRLACRHGADLIHNVLVGTEYLSYLSLRVARRLGIPFVITPLVHVGKWADGPFFLELYRRADAVIALLEVEKQFYIENGVSPDRIHVIGVSPRLQNGPYEGRGFRQKYGIKGKLVLFVGRKTRDKGYPQLRLAAPRVWARHPDTAFVFIGPQEWETRNENLATDPRIIDLGQVDEVEKGAALAACDLLCLPSVSEVLPTVFLEAWSLGKPVIGGDIPTLRELIDEGGLTVPQTPEAIAQCVIRLLDQPDLREEMGQKGHAKVMTRYTSERIVTRTGALYEAVR